jgi:hypothetical protein
LRSEEKEKEAVRFVWVERARGVAGGWVYD